MEQGTNKQANEVVFSHKRSPVNHPSLFLMTLPAPFKKHFGLILDEKLNFKLGLVCPFNVL